MTIVNTGHEIIRVLGVGEERRWEKQFVTQDVSSVGLKLEVVVKDVGSKHKLNLSFEKDITRKLGVDLKALLSGINVVVGFGFSENLPIP